MEKLTFYQRLFEAKKEIGVIAKNAKNPHFKNTYADINALITEVEPILLNHGLLLLQPILEGKQFTIIQDVDSKEKIESYLDLPINVAPQPMGSAITYYRRYTLQSLLSLRADDDDGQSVPKLNYMSDADFAKQIESKITSKTHTVEQFKETFKSNGYSITAEQLQILNK